MKGNLFIQLCDVKSAEELAGVVADIDSYTILDDWFEEIFTKNDPSKMQLREEVTGLLAILDLWNYIDSPKQPMWSLKDASNTLQQLNIPVKAFVQKVCQFPDFQKVKSNLELVQVIVNVCTSQFSLVGLQDRFEDLLTKLATLDSDLNGYSKQKNELYILGKKFAKLFLKLDKEFNLASVNDPEYELKTFTQQGFLAWKTLIKLGFDSRDIARKFCDSHATITESDAKHPVFIKFKRPMAASELKRLENAIAAGADDNPSTSTALPAVMAASVEAAPSTKIPTEAYKQLQERMQRGSNRQK